MLQFLNAGGRTFEGRKDQNEILPDILQRSRRGVFGSSPRAQQETAGAAWKLNAADDSPMPLDRCPLAIKLLVAMRLYRIAQEAISGTILVCTLRKP
jgi:hypothetical protein